MKFNYEMYSTLPHTGRTAQGCRGAFSPRWTQRFPPQHDGLLVHSCRNTDWRWDQPRVATPAQCIYSDVLGHQDSGPSREEAVWWHRQSHPGFLSAWTEEKARQRHVYPQPPTNRCANTGIRAWWARGALLLMWAWTMAPRRKVRQPCLVGNLKVVW